MSNVVNSTYSICYYKEKSRLFNKALINVELFIPDFSKTPKLNLQYAFKSLREKIFYDLMLKYYHVCSLFCQYCDSLNFSVGVEAGAAAIRGEA